MNSAVVSVSYDGIYSHYCGVGTMVQTMTSALDKLNKNRSRFGLYLITSSINPHCLGFSKTLKNESRTISKRNGGRVIELESFKDSLNQYGNTQTWKNNSREIYLHLKELSEKYNKVLVFLHDAPFLGVAKYCIQRGMKNVTFVWIPHGTGYFHGKDKKSRTQRINWEKSNLLKSNLFFVAFISKFMRTHLSKRYLLTKKQLVDLRNGVIFYEEENLPKNCKNLLNILPENKKIVLSYGRSEPYKNLVAPLRASKYFDEDLFCLIIASNNTSDNPENEKLLKLSKKTSNCLVIPHQVERGQIAKLIHENPTLIVVPSLQEPFGMIPCEARIWGKKSGSILLVSRRGGLKEQINDKIDGYLIKSDNPKKLANQINKICRMNKSDRIKISKEGYKTAKKDYNYVERLRSLLNAFL